MDGSDQFIPCSGGRLAINFAARDMKAADNLLEISGADPVSYTTGQSILEVALLAGIPFCHECGGNAKCSTCRIIVVAGDLNMQPPAEKELRMMGKAGLEKPVRLACQARLNTGKVSVGRIFKDETDYSLYLGSRRPHHEQDLGKEMEMALFFLDIRNFTRFIKHHLAFDAIHLVRKLFSVFEDEIHKQRGKIIETAGDGLYAAFGFSQENLMQSANDAFKAGRGILQRLHTLNQEYFSEVFREKIQVGIGLHVGKVAVGKLTVEAQSHQIVMGYPVNIAARLESLTKRLNNDFIVSDDAYRLFSEKTAGAFRTLKLKGTSSKWKVHMIGEPYH